MKKFLVALLMMAVVLTGVFAVDGYKAPDTKAASTGTAQINITTSIKEEWPKFQLAVKSGDAAVVTNDVNATANDFTASALTKDLTSDASATVVFAINQVSDSRTKDNYTLTVTATDLLLVKKADNTAVAFTAEHTADQKFVLTTGHATPRIDGVTITNVTGATPASGNVLSTAYNGKKVKVADALELGTFSVTWNQNENAEAGDYEAHIILAVASV